MAPTWAQDRSLISLSNVVLAPGHRLQIDKEGTKPVHKSPQSICWCGEGPGWVPEDTHRKPSRRLGSQHAAVGGSMLTSEVKPDYTEHRENTDGKEKPVFMAGDGALVIRSVSPSTHWERHRTGGLQMKVPTHSLPPSLRKRGTGARREEKRRHG